MTKRKIFPAILYFVITFLIGIFLSVILTPTYLYGSDLLLNVLVDSLEEGSYTDAVSLIGGYFNDAYVYKQDIEGGGTFLLYETISLTEETIPAQGDDDEETTISKLQKSYTGFLFGTKDVYNITKEIDNKAELTIDTDGKKVSYSILDLGSDKKTLGYCTTYEKRGLILIEFAAKTYPTINGLTFVDCDGNEFLTINFSSALNYETDFYKAAEPLITEFNARSNEYLNGKVSEETDAVLAEKEEVFLKANETFKKATVEKAEKVADKKARRTIIIYFVIVYVLADLLFTQFIIKFVKFLLVKVFKINPKSKAAINYGEGFGNDYYCGVTLKLTLQENLQFDQNIIVRYGKGESLQQFTLTSTEGYEGYQRIKAGVYENLSVEIADGYKVDGLPSALVVGGYKKTITAKIVRREDNAYENNN